MRAAGAEFPGLGEPVRVAQRHSRPGSGADGHRVGYASGIRVGERHAEPGRQPVSPSAPGQGCLRPELAALNL